MTFQTYNTYPLALKRNCITIIVLNRTYQGHVKTCWNNFGWEWTAMFRELGPCMVHVLVMLLLSLHFFRKISHGLDIVFEYYIILIMLPMIILWWKLIWSKIGHSIETGQLCVGESQNFQWLGLIPFNYILSLVFVKHNSHFRVSCFLLPKHSGNWTRWRSSNRRWLSGTHFPPFVW